MLSVKIQINQPLRGGNVQDFVFPVHVCDELLGGGDEDFHAVEVDLHQRIVRELHEVFANANVSGFFIDYLEADYLVEIEAVASEFRQTAEGQVEFRLHKLAHIVHVHILQFDDELVVSPVLQVLNDIR